METLVRQKFNTIWFTYCHLRNGNLMVSHLTDLVRKRKRPDGHIEDVLVSAKEQLEGFKGQNHICTHVNGVIRKNEVLVYDGDADALLGNPRAANVVLEWAQRKGLAPIVRKSDKEPAPAEMTARVERLESRVGGIEKGIGEIKELLGAKK